MLQLFELSSAFLSVLHVIFIYIYIYIYICLFLLCSYIINDILYILYDFCQINQIK